MKQKTIVLGAPKTFDLSDQIVLNLECLGFKVIDISFDQKFRYKNLFQRLHNLVRKLLFNDRSLKIRFRFDDYKADIYKKINAVEKVDYALIIRPDNYPIYFLKDLKERTSLMVGYQWDGLHIFPEIRKYYNLFDRFYVFDPADVSPIHHPLTNFYFDYKSSLTPPFTKKKVYFLGTFLESRAPFLKKIISEIKRAGYEPQIYLLTRNSGKHLSYIDCGATFLSTPLSFEENLNHMQNAAVLIDFLNNKHQGLSFRIFEAIGSGKKILTNNASVRNYDFYNENNIFVFNENNMDALAEFLQKPFIPLDAELKKKYSFTNWIHYVLQIPPFAPICLPDVK